MVSGGDFEALMAAVSAAAGCAAREASNILSMRAY